MIMKQKNIGLSCKEATRIMVQQEFESLPPLANIRLQLHLVFCKFCRRFARQSACLNKAIKKIEENDAVSLSLERKQAIASLLQQLND